jgi:hypothetical protein
MDIETLIKRWRVEDWQQIFGLLNEHTTLFDELQTEANGFVEAHKELMDKRDISTLPTHELHAQRIILILIYFNIINQKGW